MPLSFADVTGALFNRLGRLGKVLSAARTHQDAQYINLVSLTDGAVGQFNSEPDVQSLIGSTYIGVLNSIGGNVGGLMQSIAANTLNRMIYRDTPQLNQNLTGSNLDASLLELISQMEDANAFVLAMTVAAAAATFQPNMVGNGVMTVSVKRPSDGRTLENSFAETLTFTCDSDSYEDGATAGNESFTVRGEGDQSDLFAFDWPLGSNASTGINVIDGNTDAGAGNILTNSGFTDWTSGALDNWEVVAGGSQFSQEVSLSYDGGSALKITGDGTTNISIRQEFGDGTAGTSGTLTGVTQYSVNVFMRRDGTTPGAGVLTIDLIDQDGNTTVDENNVANSFTVDLTALTVNYLPYNGVFRTPYIMPDELYLRIRISTALTSGRAVYLDKLSMGLMTQLYTSGPYVAGHSGSVPFRNGDQTTTEVTNSRGAAGTLDTWQTCFARLFPTVYSSELLLPSSATPNLSDDLITR